MKFFKNGGLYMLIYIGCLIGQIAMYLEGKFDLVKTILVISIYTILVITAIFVKRKKEKILNSELEDKFKL